MKYTVAILKKGNDLQLVTLIKDSISYDDTMEDVKKLHRNGYKLESCIKTNKREVYYKNKLRGRLAEYQNYLETSEERLSLIERSYGKQSNVYKQTEIAYKDYSETLKGLVAKCAKICLSLGMPVNEFCVECIILYNNSMVEEF